MNGSENALAVESCRGFTGSLAVLRLELVLVLTLMHGVGCSHLGVIRLSCDTGLRIHFENRGRMMFVEDDVVLTSLDVGPLSEPERLSVVYQMWDHRGQAITFEMTMDRLEDEHVGFPTRICAMRRSLHLVAALGYSLRQCDKALNLSPGTCRTWTARYPTDYGLLYECVRRRYEQERERLEQSIKALYA